MQLLLDRVIKVVWWHGAVAVVLLCGDCTCLGLRAMCVVRVGGRRLATKLLGGGIDVIMWRSQKQSETGGRWR